MPLLTAQAQLLSNNQLVAGVIDEIIYRDDLFAVLPFLGVNGKAYVYNQENTLGTASWLNPGTDTVVESASTFNEIVTTLKVLAGDVDVDKFLQTTMSDTNDQMAIQIAKKAKGVALMFHQTLATGCTGTMALGSYGTAGVPTGTGLTVTPTAFDGLPVWAAAAQNYAATVGGQQQDFAATNGGPLTLALMDELCDLVPNGADVIVMRRGTIRAYRGLLRATYGTDAVMQQLENFGRPMLTHNGIPIIMNEFLAANEVQGTNVATCSMYALRLNEMDGLHGLYGGDSAGLVVENIGTVQNKDSTRIRVKWYTGMALKSTRSIARITGITNI